MKANTGGDRASAWSDALVREIKAEMGRQDIRSFAEMGRRVGMSHQKVKERLESSRGGGRVGITPDELYRFATALGLSVRDLIDRVPEPPRKKKTG